MLDSIPYNTVPAETLFNVGVFLVNYTKRADCLNLGEAYCQDFDIVFTGLERADDAAAIKMIMERLVNNN